MSAFNDFAIDPCVADQLKVCIQVKQQLLAKLGRLATKASSQLGGTSGTSAAITSNTAIRTTLDEFYTCLLTNLQNAYTLAGETFPALPSSPDPIDFSPSAGLAAPIVDRANAGPLDFLSSVMTIELDESGNPTFIRCP